MERALAGGFALIGLYSVLAYLVAERTREIGIHIAIGADAGRVRRMILEQRLRSVIGRIVVGGIMSMAAVRVLRAWMYEMSVYAAPTFIAAAALLCIVALLASWLPARRASRVDPVLALPTVVIRLGRAFVAPPTAGETSDIQHLEAVMARRIGRFPQLVRPGPSAREMP